jgi:hypothetical protein
MKFYAGQCSTQGVACGLPQDVLFASITGGREDGDTPPLREVIEGLGQRPHRRRVVGVRDDHPRALSLQHVETAKRLLGLLRERLESLADDVELLADSELVVKQVRGEYKVRHADLIPLHAEALRLIATFRRFKIRYVPREKNKDADKLVNRALNLSEAGGDGSAVKVHETFE